MCTSTLLLSRIVSTSSQLRNSPFELLYGVRARLPRNLEPDAEMIGDWASPDIDTVQAIVTRANDVVDKTKQLRQVAKSNIDVAQEKQKQRYIRYQTPHTDITVGDRVMWYNRSRDTRKGGKLNKHYDGPYVISEVTKKGLYRPTTPSGSPLKTVANSKDLKLAPTDGYASPPASPKTTPRKSTKTTPNRRRRPRAMTGGCYS